MPKIPNQKAREFIMTGVGRQTSNEAPKAAKDLRQSQSPRPALLAVRLIVVADEEAAALIGAEELSHALVLLLEDHAIEQPFRLGVGIDETAGEGSLGRGEGQGELIAGRNFMISPERHRRADGAGQIAAAPKREAVGESQDRNTRRRGKVTRPRTKESVGEAVRIKRPAHRARLKPVEYPVEVG